MALFLLIILLCIALGGTIWGVMRKDRFYQFPTLFCSTWLLYFGPQTVGAVINKHKYPASLRADHGLELALFFCILCAIMGLLGYAYGGKTRRRLFRFGDYSYDRIFIGGLVLYAIGFLGAYKLAQLSGGFVDEFTGGSHYGLEWRGAPVRYAFFAQLVYPGFLLVFLATLYRPSILRWIITCFCLLYPLAIVVFLGRRSMAGLLAIMVLLSLFFAKRWAPRRVSFASCLVLATIGVIVAPAYRSKSQFGLSMQELGTIDTRGLVVDTFSGEHYGEFDMIVYGCAATQRGLAFDYGLNFYNAAINVFVPRQLVGEKLKSNLLLQPSEDIGTLVDRYYKWTVPYGTNPTGPYDAFRQFWLFGCLLYFALGYIYRRLWTAACSEANVGAQLWYAMTAILIPMSVFGGIGLLAPKLLQIFVILGSVLYVSKDACGTRRIRHIDPTTIRHRPRPCNAPGSRI